jgi:hypothetical protein
VTGKAGPTGMHQRRWRDDGVAGSTWDGGVSVEGLLWRSPVAWRGGVLRQETEGRGGCRWRGWSGKEAGVREKWAATGAAPFLRGATRRQRMGGGPDRRAALSEQGRAIL